MLTSAALRSCAAADLALSFVKLCKSKVNASARAAEGVETERTRECAQLAELIVGKMLTKFQDEQAAFVRSISNGKALADLRQGDDEDLKFSFSGNARPLSSRSRMTSKRLIT
jgi:hypothetical protein